MLFNAVSHVAVEHTDAATPWPASVSYMHALRASALQRN